MPAGLVARCLDSDRGFRLVVSPTDDSLASLDALASWMERDRAIVKQWLAIYGAVLFRGFESADGAAEFEKVAQHLADAPLADVYLGTSPRVPVAGTKHVFTASEFAPWKVVPPHCEMSFAFAAAFHRLLCRVDPFRLARRRDASHRHARCHTANGRFSAESV